MLTHVLLVCLLQEGDAYEVIPGSDFTVARTANRYCPATQHTALCLQPTATHSSCVLQPQQPTAPLLGASGQGDM
jgi:hypothetical protein